jgi:protein-disulfide isomerase
MQLELLAFRGADALRGARAAAVAADQDRLWQFADLFFLQQGEENSGYADDAFLARIARQAGVQAGAPGSEALLREAARRAERFGVDSTPAFVLVQDGREPQVLEVSALDGETVARALDEALAGG